MKLDSGILANDSAVSMALVGTLSNFSKARCESFSILQSQSLLSLFCDLRIAFFGHPKVTMLPLDISGAFLWVHYELRTLSFLDVRRKGRFTNTTCEVMLHSSNTEWLLPSLLRRAIPDRVSLFIPLDILFRWYQTF